MGWCSMADPTPTPTPEVTDAWAEIPRSCLTGYDEHGNERVLTLAEAIRALVYERDQALEAAVHAAKRGQ